MANLLKRLVRAADHYTVWDFGFLKLCMLGLGILLGAYFASFFREWIVAVWVVFVFCWIVIIFRTFRYMSKYKE